MLLAETIAEAARRWIALLRTSAFPQASALIRADARYIDLTKTQYSTALDWLTVQKFVRAGENGLELNPRFALRTPAQMNQVLFERILETSDLPWLADADSLIPDASELPQDAAKIGAMLGLSDMCAFLTVRQIHGRIDLEKRALTGAAGEKALMAFLELRWPGAASHVAESNDGFGYDIAFFHSGVEWHLEVKSSVRRGRLTVYLSRHEFEVGRSDPNWRLIIVGLTPDLRMHSLSTAPFPAVVCRAPADSCFESKWQSASFQLPAEELVKGLDFVDELRGFEFDVPNV